MAQPSKAPTPAPRFVSISLSSQPESVVGRRSATLTFSIVLHAVLIALTIIVPLLLEDVMPVPGDAVRAFFVSPAEAPPPPPPPPPPAPAARPQVQRPPQPQPQQDAKFVAPIEIPDEMPPDEESFDAFGIEGGVPGGVEGGVPGGVVGGVVGGLPTEPPPAPRVRIGGQIVAPKVLNRTAPVYPELARQARVAGVVIMEAIVGIDGRVKSVSVLRGHPLLDPAATDAVRQWRYQPLLLNGVPTEFVLTVTLVFNLASTGS